MKNEVSKIMEPCVRILICGSRDWSNADVIRQRLNKIKCNVIVIHGGCRGADKLAGEIAQSMGMKVEVYIPDWKSYGKAAGPLRNQRMLDEGKPTIVIAFHNDIINSKGTADMVNRAKNLGMTVEIIKEDLQDL